MSVDMQRVRAIVFNRIVSIARGGLGPIAACLVLGWCVDSASLVNHPTALAAEMPKPPNIVLVLADDLGWSDVGCNGTDLLETPHIDRLAREGMRFTNAYAMSVCSPTRAMLLTGKHAARLGITIWSEGSLQGPANRKLLQAKSKHDLPHSEMTLATHLQKAGYVTALVGKWHLGDADHAPETHGFDINIGGTHWGAPQTFWWPYRGRGRFGDSFRYVPHLEFGKPGEYLTDRLTDEAIRIIDGVQGRPFFLYLAHHAPHTPIEAKPDDVAYFESRRLASHRHQNTTYAAMVKNLDENVGRLREHLAKRDLDQNTIFLFTSDNGGYINTDGRSKQSTPVTSNWPLRSGKGSLYEGGIRVPMLVRWPGVTQDGSTTEEPVIHADWFATLARLADSDASPASDIDGVDLRSLLQVPKQRSPNDPFFSLPTLLRHHHTSRPYVATTGS